MEAERDGALLRVWVISFTDGLTPEYTAFIQSPDGTVLEAQNGSRDYYTQQWTDSKGSQRFWSLADREMYFQLFDRLIEAPPNSSLPGEDDVPQDEALALAKTYVLSETEQDPDTLDDLLVGTYFFRYDDPSKGDAEWVFQFWDADWDSGGRDYTLYQVTVSAADGALMGLFDIVKDGPGLG